MSALQISQWTNGSSSEPATAPNGRAERGMLPVAIDSPAPMVVATATSATTCAAEKALLLPFAA